MNNFLSTTHELAITGDYVPFMQLRSEAFWGQAYTIDAPSWFPTGSTLNYEDRTEITVTQREF